MSINETIQQEIQKTVPQMIEDSVTIHDHTPGNSQTILGSSLANCPQISLTTANVGSISSGGLTIISTNDSAILTNMQIRINEIESRLKAIGLIS